MRRKMLRGRAQRASRGRPAATPRGSTRGPPKRARSWSCLVVAERPQALTQLVIRAQYVTPSRTFGQPEHLGDLLKAHTFESVQMDAGPLTDCKTVDRLPHLASAGALTGRAAGVEPPRAVHFRVLETVAAADPHLSCDRKH